MRIVSKSRRIGTSGLFRPQYCFQLRKDPLPAEEYALFFCLYLVFVSKCERSNFCLSHILSIELKDHMQDAPGTSIDLVFT